MGMISPRFKVRGRNTKLATAFAFLTSDFGLRTSDFFNGRNPGHLGVLPRFGGGARRRRRGGRGGSGGAFHPQEARRRFSAARRSNIACRKPGCEPEHLDYVGFYDKPLLKFERLLETYLAYAPVGFRSFLTAMPLWLKKKLYLPRELNRGLGHAYRKRYVFTEHHESHAASAFFPSPFDEAAILTVDGVGEWATASFGTGSGNRINLTHELHFPHSPGMLYSAFTYYCGFKVNSGEYKLMGLAPYGEPKHVDLILEKLIDLKDDGSFRMDMSYFNYCQGLTMTSKKFERLFGGPPRQPEDAADAARHGHCRFDPGGHRGDHAADRATRPRRNGHEKTLPGRRRGAQLRGQRPDPARGPIRRSWIQPAAGDAGGALGVALFIWHQLLDKSAATATRSTHNTARTSGREFSDDEIRGFLDGVGARYRLLRAAKTNCATPSPA